MCWFKSISLQNRLLLVEVTNVLIQIDFNAKSTSTSRSVRNYQIISYDPEVDLPMPCPAEQPCRKKLRARSEALSSSHSNASVRGRPRRFSDVTSAQLRTGAGRPYWGPGLSAPKRPVGPPAEGLLEGGGPPAPLGPGGGTARRACGERHKLGIHHLCIYIIHIYIYINVSV